MAHCGQDRGAKADASGARGAARGTNTPCAMYTGSTLAPPMGCLKPRGQGCQLQQRCTQPRAPLHSLMHHCTGSHTNTHQDFVKSGVLCAFDCSFLTFSPFCPYNFTRQPLTLVLQSNSDWVFSRPRGSGVPYIFTLFILQKHAQSPNEPEAKLCGGPQPCPSDRDHL